MLINHYRPESNNSLNEGESNLSSKKFSYSINKRLFPNGSHSAKADNRGKDMNSAVKNILENSFEKKVENEEGYFLTSTHQEAGKTNENIPVIFGAHLRVS